MPECKTKEEERANHATGGDGCRLDGEKNSRESRLAVSVSVSRVIHRKEMIRPCIDDPGVSVTRTGSAHLKAFREESVFLSGDKE